MQRIPDQPVMARHARLFELLRQENVALSARAKLSDPHPADHDAVHSFRKMAEQSFFQGRPTL